MIRAHFKIALFLALVEGVASAQTKSPEAVSRPLTLPEIVYALNSGAPSENMITLVKRYGVDFALTPGAKKQLLDAGASDDLAEEIGHARVQIAPATAGSKSAKKTASKAGRGVSKENVTSPPDVAELIVSADMACSWKIDGKPEPNLTPDEPQTVTVDLGEHLFEAQSSDKKERWSKVINLENAFRKVVLIELAKARSDREQQEKAQAREEADQQARKDAEAAEQAARARAQAAAEQRRLQAGQLMQQVAELENQANDANSEAQESDRRAEQFEQQCAQLPNPALCVNRMFIGTNREAARRKRQEAAQARNKIRTLKAQLAGLN